MAGEVGHGPDVPPALTALLRQVWGPDGVSPATGDWPVRVTTGSSPGTGWRPVERYAVLPGLRRPRLLVPATSRLAGAAFLGQNRALRSRTTAGVRTVLQGAVLAGVLPRAAQDRLVVWVDPRVSEGDLGRYLLSRYLQEQLGSAPVHLGLSVRPPDPNHKPSLQLYSADGAVLGYVKVGWNDATRALVDNEVDVLRSLSAAPPRLVTFPELRHASAWCGRHLLLADALPGDLAHYAPAGRAPGADVLRDVAGAKTQRSRLSDSGYLAALREQSRAVTQRPESEALGQALAAMVDRVDRCSGAEVLEFGRWHGDLVPWNVGVRRERLHVWDWEHGAQGVPVGFDLLHWHFQVAFVARREALAPSLALARRHAAADWAALGVPAGVGVLVGRLYTAELALRTHRLMRGGGGWNPRLYPAIIDVLQHEARAEEGRRQTGECA